jgi:VanZ family protein
VAELNKRTRWQQNRGWIFLAVGYAAIFVTILIVAYQGKLPAFLTQNDKPAHVILYAIATFVGHRACHRRSLQLGRFNLPAFPFGFTVFTIAEELFQSFSPNRSLDAWDLVASFVGIGLGYGLAQMGSGRRKEKE